ncbi:class I SAM-dependent methyltransferase [Hymenobacter elongatus]|uniref:Class I SAM-dependent methyltransferase n=1 Tax=Hymenobacter elongatus TaxID=877208 RepID=A0A4Z0PF69_9BACT|nr:class I SAM-dependent methyltransferase [Hymenobacter elongatus]TGE11894.1 class I SAM-dependent methyltransferase [Hymenobacter elongatus]
MNTLAKTMIASQGHPGPQTGNGALAAPRKTLVAALQLFDAPAAPGLALDLGCGVGADTLELLNRSWNVVAVDSDPEALATLLTQMPAHHMSRLTTRLLAFEELSAARMATFDLVNASFSLPYCPPADFNGFWANVGQLIRRNGRFCGHFFGLSHTARAEFNTTLHSLVDIYALLAGFEVEMLNGVEKDQPQPDGSMKHSHIISVVARKY